MTEERREQIRYLNALDGKTTKPVSSFDNNCELETCGDEKIKMVIVFLREAKSSFIEGYICFIITGYPLITQTCSLSFSLESE